MSEGPNRVFFSVEWGHGSKYENHEHASFFCGGENGEEYEINGRQTLGDDLFGSLMDRVRDRVANLVNVPTEQQAVQNVVGAGLASAPPPAPNSGDDWRARAPHCPHGRRVPAQSKPGAPRPWRAYMCPLPKGAQGKCPPIDADTLQPWRA